MHCSIVRCDGATGADVRRSNSIHCSGQLRWCKSEWRSITHECYSIGMQVIARLIPLLLLAFALASPASAPSSKRESTLIESSAAIMQSAPLYGTHQAGMKCYRCKWKACGKFTVACSAHCDAASVLTSLGVVPAMTPHRSIVLSVFRSLPEQRGAPDPHPPRLIAIS